MFTFLLLVKLLAILVSADDHNDILPPTRRVFYGDLARIEDYPSYAALHNCGAAIVSNFWIVTAAHCVRTPAHIHQKYVYVGGNTMADSVRVSYNEVIIHPEYKDFSGGVQLNDIALLKLTAPLKFSATVQPARLPTTPHRNAVVVSRGLDETHQKTLNLRKVDLLVLPTNECLKAMPHFLARSTICTKRRGTIVPSTCNGDSGSPLLNGNTLVGLVSYGHKICELQKLAFHTNILNYVPWIRANTGI